MQGLVNTTVRGPWVGAWIRSNVIHSRRRCTAGVLSRTSAAQLPHRRTLLQEDREIKYRLEVKSDWIVLLLIRPLLRQRRVVPVNVKRHLCLIWMYIIMEHLSLWLYIVFFCVTSRLIKACSVTSIIHLSSHLYLFCSASAFTFCVPVDAYLIKLRRRRCADRGYEVRCEFKGGEWLMSKYSDDNREPCGADWTPLSFVQLIKPARVWLSSQRRRM